MKIFLIALLALYVSPAFPQTMYATETTMPTEARLCMLGSCFHLTLRDDGKSYDARGEGTSKPHFTCAVEDWKREKVSLTCVSKELVPKGDDGKIYLFGRIPDGGEKIADAVLGWTMEGIPGFERFSLRWCDYGPCPH